MSVIGRLGRYIEVIDKLPEEKTTISSQELASLVGATASTVRQDFHNFLNKQGKSRVGYDVRLLRETLLEIVGLHRETQIIVLGCGKLGRALAGYTEFKDINIRFAAFFDTDETKVNQRVEDIPVFHLKELRSFMVKNPGVKMAILTVPADMAQEVAAYAGQCGIEAIWNFSPVLLQVKEDTVVQNEYIGESLYKLIYELNQRTGKGGKKMELTVCVGSSCHLKGSEEVVKRMQGLIEKEKMGKRVTLKGSFCMGQCSDTGVTIEFDNNFHKTTPETVESFFKETVLPKVK